MFNLEQAIITWRRQLAASDALSVEALEELESHLREEIELLQNGGLSDQNAFEVAVRKLGQASLLQSEFAKATINGGKALLLRVSCFVCSIFLVLTGVWTILSFEPVGISRALGLSALAAIALYILCLPRLFATLTSRAIFQTIFKITGILIPLWCLWLLLSINWTVPLPNSLSIQMVIWCVCAAHGMTVLVTLFYRRDRSVPLADLSDLSLAACQSLGAAREQAFLLNHDFVGTEHLLLGLLQSENQKVQGALKKWDISDEVVRREIQTIMGQAPLNNSVQKTQPIPYTPRAQKALEVATLEAKALNHSSAGPEHILLGLLREPTGVAGIVLRKLGVDTNAVREAIRTQ